MIGIVAAMIINMSWIPVDYQAMCYQIAPEYELEPEIMIALIETESSGQTTITNADGSCVGLCQLNKNYFSGDLTDPENNITQACEYLSKLRDRYSGSMAAALMGYHGEYDPMGKAEAGNISDYATKIINRAEELKNETRYDNDTGGGTGVYSGNAYWIPGRTESNKADEMEKDLPGGIRYGNALRKNSWYKRMSGESSRENRSIWGAVC